MSVYVDDPIHPFGRMMMCHMVADTRQELFAMVKKIGVPLKWIQRRGTEREHFDVCKSKREEAIAAGAIAVDSSEIVACMRRKVVRI